MKTFALASLLLTACSGAPFTVEEATAVAPDVVSEPDAAPEADAAPPPAVPEAAAPAPDVAPTLVEASAPDVSPPPPGTLCCRLAGPTTNNCSTSAPLVNYPCGTTLGGWIYSVSSTDDKGMIHVADVDCTYGPPTTANIGDHCQWGVGTAPAAANCGFVAGAVVECGQ